MDNTKIVDFNNFANNPNMGHLIGKIKDRLGVCKFKDNKGNRFNKQLN